MKTLDFRDIRLYASRKYQTIAFLEGLHAHSDDRYHITRATVALMALSTRRYDHERRATLARKALKGFHVHVEECRRPDGSSAVRLFSGRKQIEIYISWF